MPDKFKIPQFTSEAEEAQWWFDHRQEPAGRQAWLAVSNLS
jgi:hypothetical protein